MTKNKMIVNSRKTGSAQNWIVSVTIRYTLVDQQGLDKTKSGREKKKTSEGRICMRENGKCRKWTQEKQRNI